MYNGKRYRYLALYYEPEQLELIDKYGLVVVRKGRQCIDCAVPDDVQTDADFVEDMAKLNKRYQERWNALLESVMNRVETDADFQRYIQECWKSNMLLLEENEAIYETR